MISFPKETRGQAMTEMLVAIPLLFLLAAGIIQFSVLFLTYVGFEHACGESAREYCAGMVGQDALGPSILRNTGYFARFLDPGSLNIMTQKPGSVAVSALNAVSGLTGSLNAVARTIPALPTVDFSGKYEGCLWRVSVCCRPPAFFGLLFPRGIVLRTTLQAYRYAE
jgi:Flp pilus assembly protein TadG